MSSIKTTVPIRFLQDFIKCIDWHGGHGSPTLDRAMATALSAEAKAYITHPSPDALVRVRIKEGWEGTGREGAALAQVMVGQCWTVVVWDDEEDPECHKAAGLEEITMALDGWELTQGVMVMVRATMGKGHKLRAVVMHPSDFEAMRDWRGQRLKADATIYDLPIELDEGCEPGKILAVK